jgi:hypothetical protein
MKPDSTSAVVVNDFQNFCDMSTFLENGLILVKLRRRFMVFNSNGSFIDEIEFNRDLKAEDEKSESDVNMLSVLNTARHLNVA